MSGQRERKVAITTSDGIHVHDHFARAPFFLILKMRGNKVLERELRDNPFRDCGEEARDRPLCLSLINDVLPDVDVVVSAGMGKNAYVTLLNRNILPLLTRESGLERAIMLYKKGGLKEEGSLVWQPRCVY